MMIQKSKTIMTALAGALGVKAASLIKISFIVGSYTAFFSGTSIAMPLVGAFSGSIGSVITFLCGMLLSASLSWKILAYHVPGLIAALYWSRSSVLMSTLIPMLCFIFFVTHPTGSQAWPYALYWLIPITLGFTKNPGIFTQALISTFIAHAVGSVIWLYTVPMSAQAWNALIPLVACERLVFASGMVMVHASIVWLGNKLPKAKLLNIIRYRTIG